MSWIFFYRINEEVTVESHSWALTYQMEEFQAVRESRDCPAPNDAYSISSRTETRTRQVQDGQTCRQECSNRRIDQGDGSFRTVRECRDVCEPRYRDERYQVEVCSYTIDKWVELDEPDAAPWAMAIGNNLNPVWPDIESQYPQCDNASAQLGVQCWEDRQEEYTLQFRRENGEIATCKLNDIDKWQAFKDGEKAVVPFTFFSRLRDKALCDEIEPIG